MTWLGAFGGYFLKKASSGDVSQHRKHTIGWLIVGVGCYGFAAILNIVALQFLPYTIVFPLTAVTYIWTMLISKWILNETISIRKIAGVTFIVLGAIILVL